jgi:hypothetical protein
MPGEAPFSAIVEGNELWGDTRINRKLDARWRGLARGVLDSVTATTVAYLQFAAVAVDTEGLSIGGADGTRRIYEFSTAVAPVLSYGDVVVGTNGMVTATAVAAALQVAIHNDPLGPMRANLVQAGADTLMFTSRDARNYGDLGALNYEIITHSAGGAPGAWGTPPTALRNVANSVIAGSGVTPAAYQECHGSYGVTAADATIAAAVGEGLAVACVRFQPTFGQYVVLTAAGIPRSLDAMSFNWTQVDDSGKFALMVFDTVPTLANTDTIHWRASIY